MSDSNTTPTLDPKVGEYYNQTFDNILFSESQLDEVEFDNCTFKNCNFSGTQFKHCKFIDCHFYQCNLSNIHIGYSHFNEVFFDHCKMIGIDWTRAHWPNLALYSPLKFSHCILNDSSFQTLIFVKVILAKEILSVAILATVYSTEPNSSKQILVMQLITTSI